MPMRIQDEDAMDDGLDAIEMRKRVESAKERSSSSGTDTSGRELRKGTVFGHE